MEGSGVSFWYLIPETCQPLIQVNADHGTSMQAHCMTPELIARYDQRVPRYTSYPTAPHFKADVTAETYASWLAELAPDGPLSLYLHVPFCAELCLYCGCNTAVARSYKAVASYVVCLEREIDLVAQHLPGPMAVSHIHWAAARRLFCLRKTWNGSRVTSLRSSQLSPELRLRSKSTREPLHGNM